MSRDGSAAGYAAAADTLAVQYESVTFDQVHAPVLDLIPAPPGRALDIGAGTGRDAAALARRGFAVTAVEPTVELRAHGEALHAGLGITWVDDGLPDLAELVTRPERFDLIFLTAVWMHLDAAERTAAMAALAALAGPDARLFMTLRHGPVPDGRRMFDVQPGETVELAGGHGFRLLHQSGRGDMFARPQVRWSHLVLGR